MPKRSTFARRIRDVLSLCYREGFTKRKIARCLDDAEGMVTTYLSRAELAGLGEKDLWLCRKLEHPGDRFRPTCFALVLSRPSKG